MKTKISIAMLIVVVLMLFVGCIRQGTPVCTSGAVDDFKVIFLFEVDGIKVYRFYDDCHYRYFSTKGMISNTQTSGGKSHAIFNDQVIEER